MLAKRGRGPLLMLVALLGCVASAAARPYLPPGDHVFAGLTGGTSITEFQKLVGKHPPVFEIYMTWDTPTGWLRNADPGFRSRLALHISTAPGYAKPGVISPEQIALGRSDRFLVDLGGNLAASRRIVYIRIMGEPNGYWNAYAPFNANGSFRGVQNSAHFYIQAWRRTVLILRGGPVAAIDRGLHRLGMAPLQVNTRPPHTLARPSVAFLWVPQDAGSPQIAANAPSVFWPGSEYVDWVGTDFYGSYPNFSLLDAFYAQFAGKPFVLSEWGLYGADNPGFVRTLFAWVGTHSRVRMLNYYQGFGSSDASNLADYPRSQAALRAVLRSPRFPAYAPEYAQPSGPGQNPPHNPNPGSNPLPPQPAAPPAVPPVCLPLLQLCIPGL